MSLSQNEFWDTLTKFHGHIEPLQDTVSVLSYEVGRMMEHAMFMKWRLTDPIEFKIRMGFFKSELIDAIAQCLLICSSVGEDFEEMKTLGIEKAMERFTHKERK